MSQANETTKIPPVIRAPELSERVNLQLLDGTKDALESMAREAGFEGRYCVAEFIRGGMEARIKHERPAVFARIKGAA